jgi:hypothetical protein
VGWWRRLTGQAEAGRADAGRVSPWRTRPAWLVDGMQAAVVTGPETLEVVGESFYQDALWAIVGGHRRGTVRHQIDAVLVAEEGNPYDPNAVAVWIECRQVGHIPRSQAPQVRRGLLALVEAKGMPIALTGEIVGGHDEYYEAGMLGVFLKWDPAVFSMRAPPAHHSTTHVRTGLAEAVTSDLDDDSYDLAWMNQLPSEPEQRIARLVDLLDTSTEPISRHYMHALLVSDLYKQRERSPGDMAAFDVAAADHDQEMDALRPALVDKFGGVPLIETYRFASIRHGKAGDYITAIDWCERGLALYADQALTAEGVDDLRNRATRYRQQLPADRTGSAPATSGVAHPAEHSGPPIMEVLTCQRCGATFERPVVRGRKPHLCPECRAAA